MAEKTKYEQMSTADRLKTLRGLAGRNPDLLIVDEMLEINNRLTKIEKVFRQFPNIREYLEKLDSAAPKRP